MCLVEGGIVHVLTLQLGLVLNGRGSSSTTTFSNEDIERVCIALDVFYRFSPETTSETALHTRGKETFRLLSDAFRCGVVLPVVSVWHSCSSRQFGAWLLSTESFILESITNGFRKGHFQGEGCLLEVLGLIKNISFYGEGEIRQRILHESGLLSSLMSLPEMPLPEKGEEHLSAILRNLALSTTTRVALAQRGEVLTCLVRLANDASIHTLRNLVNTLVSMTMEEDSCLLIIFHGEGVILELLKRFLFCEMDETVRKRAARILRLMARESCVPLLDRNSKLLHCLSDRALNDPSIEVRSEATEAFGKYAGLTVAAMDQHEAVLGALAHLANSPYIHADVLARAVKEQSSHLENRIPLSRCGKVLDALATIVLSPDISEVVKENVCNAFLNLSRDENTREAIASQSTLNALVHCAETVDTRQSTMREIAVQTLTNLANHPANGKCMAKKSRLIQSLLQFAATTNNDAMKKEVKLVLLKLAAEL